MARPASSASSAPRRTTGFSIYVLATLLRRIAARRRPSVLGPATRARSARAAAPRPPPDGLTQSTDASTSGAASAGAADRPTRDSTGRSRRSSPMNATAESSSPACRQIASYASALCATPCETMRIPSWAARCAVAPDVLADRRPTERPARCAHTSAAPSRMWKLLDSDPSACISTAPSVSTPSTSKSKSRTADGFRLHRHRIRTSAFATDRGGGRHPRRVRGNRRRRPT